MHICLLGQNHRTAPVSLREQLAFDPDKQERLKALLHDDGTHHEGVVLSTCNRVELYTVTGEPERSRHRLGEYLQELHGVDLKQWSDTLYFHSDVQAVRHLFKVASGLDSMVLGEGQILSQVKDAMHWARENNLAHEILQRAFIEAVSCGKRVRTDTKLGEGAVSVAFAGVTLARRIFSDLSHETALLIGAGETGRRAARHLQMFGVSDIRVCNRSWDRGAGVAAELDAVHVPWDQLDNQLPEASILVTATAATSTLIDEARIKGALRRSGRRTLLCMDLSVPRDIEDRVGQLPGVFLYNVDDLQGIVLEGEDRRRAEAAKAQRIVEMQVAQFVDWFRARSAVPLLAELRRHVGELRRAELERARGNLDEEAFAALERVTERLAKKWLHGPTVGLKRLASGDRSGQVLEDFRELFDLHGPATEREKPDE